MAADIRPAATVRVRVYDVVSRAVEEGVAAGIRRAHKHTDAPTAADVHDEVERAVMLALGEVLDWEATEDDE